MYHTVRWTLRLVQIYFSADMNMVLCESVHAFDLVSSALAVGSISAAHSVRVSSPRRKWASL